jgi:hypothetical protein
MRGEHRRQTVYIDNEAFLFRVIVHFNTLKIEVINACFSIVAPYGAASNTGFILVIIL